MPDHLPVTLVQELVPLLRAQDIARSVDFYCEKLAFKMTMSWAPDGKLEWCRLEREGSAVMLQQACDEDGSPEGRGRGVEFYFNCRDANAEHVRLAGCGLNLDPPKVAFYGMNQLYLTDPDGYELCFQNVVPDK